MTSSKTASLLDMEDEPTTIGATAAYRHGPPSGSPRSKSGLAPRGTSRPRTMTPPPMPPPPRLPNVHVEPDKPHAALHLAPPPPLRLAPPPVSEPPASFAAPPAAAPRPRIWRVNAMQLNKLIVSSYKTMGFAILGFILAGLASFILINLFYLVNSSWVTPLTLSSSDARVFQLSGQRANTRAGREAVAIQRLDLRARRQDAERIAASEVRFQENFAATLTADHDSRLVQLTGFRRLLGDLAATRSQVLKSNHDFTDISRGQLKREYDAHLIDKDQHVRGGFELGQIAGANVSLHERNVEIDARVSDLTRAVESLDAARGNSQAAMSYEVLHMHHEYQQSVLTQKKAEDDVAAIDESLRVLDGEVEAYDHEIERIERAPYLMAADRSVTTAFVPYDNVGSVNVGDAVYGCRVSVVVCRKVGIVAELLDGEVLGYHPLHNRELRGVLVRLDLQDASAIQLPVLHLKHAPLGV